MIFRIKNLLSFIAAISMISSCGGHDHSSHDDHHEDEHHHDEAVEEQGGHQHGDEIVLSPEKAAAAGVKTDTARIIPFRGVIKVGGRLMPANGEEATVAANVAGIVNLNRSLTDGAQVGRSSRLLTIMTESLPEGDAVARARVTFDAAKADYDRATALLSDKLITEKEYTAIKAEYERARLAYEALGKSNGNGGVAVLAPIGGYITDIFVKEGEFVNVGQPLFTISQNKKLYLRAEVPQKYFRELNGVSSAKFRSASGNSFINLDEHGGRLVSIGRSADSNTGFIPVTFEFDATGDAIPGSYAEIYLLSSPDRQRLAIPSTSITEEQGVYYVYIQEDDDCYRKQQIKIGQTDGTLTEITEGVNPGEVVVTDGAIHVRLASASTSIPGHTHNH